MSLKVFFPVTLPPCCPKQMFNVMAHPSGNVTIGFSLSSHSEIHQLYKFCKCCQEFSQANTGQYEEESKCL